MNEYEKIIKIVVENVSARKMMEEDELDSNEKFVNCFAGFLTEAIRTMK